MRRGTPGAIAMGEFLRDRRATCGLSMRQVAGIVGTPAATVSQIEKGQRALKEPKLNLWAKALDMKPSALRVVWKRFDDMEEPPLIRGRRGKSSTPNELLESIEQLTDVERNRVRGYMDALIEQRS